MWKKSFIKIGVRTAAGLGFVIEAEALAAVIIAAGTYYVLYRGGKYFAEKAVDQLNP